MGFGLPGLGQRGDTPKCGPGRNGRGSRGEGTRGALTLRLTFRGAEDNREDRGASDC